MSSTGRGGRRPAVAMATAAFVCFALTAFLPGIEAHGATGAVGNGSPGSQGIVTGLPATASQVTVQGSGNEAGLAVTVNQTQSLTHQAVSVSWSGAPATFSDETSGAFASTFHGNYLQIMQCWSDPQTQTGPDPTQCEYGGESPSDAAYPVANPGFEYSRVLAEQGWSDYAALQASPTWVDTTDNFDVEPFDAVDGTVVNQQADYTYNEDPFHPKTFWKDPYFSYGTTNEVDFARTYTGGTGQQLFQVDTGLEAPGLGCGQDIEPAGGTTITPQCWLVVVPRATPEVENPPNSGIGTDQGVVTSPLTPSAWANRISVPLQFNPVGSSCAIGANAQQIVGSELAGPAVASWEPALCGLPGSPAFSYVEDSDDTARTNLVTPTFGSAGMSVFSNPAAPGSFASTNPVVYAPLTLSGVVVAFNIQRYPGTDPSSGQPYSGEEALAGDQVAQIDLTPRLVAKLLTESYQAQLEDVTANQTPAYAWIQHNPVSLVTDPDFLQYNPEFQYLDTTQKIDAGSLLVEEASSDADQEVWRWVLADPAAAAWLSGTPDQWGMRVNPLYTSALQLAGSSTGVAPENFPKSDPYCYQTGNTVVGPPTAPARPLCVLDWSPYALTLSAAAQDTAAANDGAKTTFNPSQTPDNAWGSNGPQVSGTHFVVSITDSASARRFGLQAAQLSAAGEDASPTFVAPDTTGILGGEQAMVPSAVPGVLEPDPSSNAAGAYPLSMLTYAATCPETLTTTQRSLYDQFLVFATGAGQTTGVQPGQLPDGYVPLPQNLLQEDLTAEATILNPPSFPSPTTTTTTTPTPTPSPVTPVASGATGGGASLPATVATSSTPVARVGPRRRPLPKASIQLAEAVSAGPLRWLLALLLGLGLAAGLGALVLSRFGRRPTAAAEAASVEATPTSEPGSPT
jgi:hypothetical protein